MNKVFGLILMHVTFLIQNLSGQLDSSYFMYNSESYFQNIHKINKKIFITGAIQENYDKDLPIYTEIEENLTRTYSSKVTTQSFYDYTLFSTNSVDGTLCYLGSNFSGTRDRILFKYNSNGDLLFSTRLSLDSVYYPRKIIQTMDTGYLIVGYSIDANLRYYGFAAKLTKNGKMEWYKKFEEDAPLSILHSSACEGNNAIYISAQKEKTKIDSPYLYSETWLYKLNYTGNIIKTWNLIDSQSAPSSTMIVDNDETVIYSGYIYKKMAFDTIKRTSRIVHQVAIFCRDKDNKLKWVLPISVDQTEWLGINSIKKLKDNNYLAVGIELKITGNDTGYQAMAVKFNKDGKVIWRKGYGKSVLISANYDVFNDFLELDNSNLMFVGTNFAYFDRNRNPNNFGKRSQGWIIHTDSQGVVIKSTSTIKNLNDQGLISLYPLPFSNQLNLNSQKVIQGDIHLYDVAGKALPMECMNIQKLSEKELTIIFSEKLALGFYYLSVNVDGEKRHFKILKHSY